MGRAFSILIFAATYSGTVAAGTRCPVTIVDQFIGGHLLKIERVEGLRTKFGEVDPTGLFGEKNPGKIIFGITNEASVYLSADGVRFHGKMSLVEGGAVVKDSYLLPEGAYLVFQEIPKPLVENVAASIRAEASRLTLSCITSACRILSENGIKLKRPALLPAGKLKSAMVHGFVDQHGVPIKVQLFASDDTNLRRAVANFRNLQLLMTIAPGTIIVSLSIAGYQLYKVGSIIVTSLLEDNEGGEGSSPSEVGKKKGHSLNQ